MKVKEKLPLVVVVCLKISRACEVEDEEEEKVMASDGEIEGSRGI